jgi:hypothetical protein
VIQSNWSINPIPLLTPVVTWMNVTRDVVWIGNQIYWTLTECNYKWPSQWVTCSEDHCTYSTLIKVLSVFTSCYLAAASNGGHSSSSGFLNYLWPQLPAYHSQQQLSSDSTNHSKSKSKSH